MALIFLRHRDQIERDRQAELRASAERLRLALEAAHMGTWDWDVLADIITGSEQVAPLFGLPAGASPRHSRPISTGFIHADRAGSSGHLAALLAGEDSDHQAVYRVLRPDGSLHWLEEQGRVYRDAIGQAAACHRHGAGHHPPQAS